MAGKDDSEGIVEESRKTLIQIYQKRLAEWARAANCDTPDQLRSRLAQLEELELAGGCCICGGKK